MYKLSNLTLPLEFNKDNLEYYVASKIKCDKNKVSNAKLIKLSIDARRKSDVKYIASVSFELIGRVNSNKVKLEEYEPPKVYHEKWRGGDKNIIIVGSGPSGLFAGLTLSEAGAKVTILERGYSMEKRIEAVNNLMDRGILDTKSNIQFGEGGAGTFSDGKLNTNTHTPLNFEVLKTFHDYGASDNIMYDARPHIGTDVLSKVIVNMRNRLESLGSKVLFEHKLTSINYLNDEIASIEVETPEGKTILPCDILILAIGHSSRDTVRMLYDKGLPFKQKPFSMGYRIEHLQEDISKSQYGDSYKFLPPADYHLSEHLENGRTIYTFCMCPGGVVVPAMSEEGTIVTNGMSYHARDGRNANSAILVNVNTSDFPDLHPLSGLDLQEKYERLANVNKIRYNASVQRVGDFLEGKPTTKLGKVIPTYKPGYNLGRVDNLLPQYIVESIKEGIVKLNNKLKGFADPDACLTGIETRTSAPYQVIRDDMEINNSNIYMIGEGAGFAGGIVSSSVEGIKVADKILSKFGN